MLRGKAEVNRLAISNKSGKAIFHVPVSKEGVVLHLAGSLDETHTRLFAKVRHYDVEIRTLDEFGFTNVGFIKVDVEGTERDVLDGARGIIMRDRPALVLELLSGTHADPGAVTKGICEDFGYEAFLVTRETKVPALLALASLGSTATYPTRYETRNVLFVAK